MSQRWGIIGFREGQNPKDNGGAVMNYKESVEKQFSDDTDEQKRRRLLWGDIVTAYDNRGEDGVKAALTEHVERITMEFKEILKKLDKKI